MKHHHAALTLERADQIATEAISTGNRIGLQPLAVAVLDNRGTVKVMKADDGTSLLRTDIARAKASGALGMGLGGRTLARRAEQNPAFMQSLGMLCAGNMVPVRGSVLIRDADGTLLGAVGISGDTAENDEICAIAGIDAADLQADPGE